MFSSVSEMLLASHLRNNSFVRHCLAGLAFVIFASVVDVGALLCILPYALMLISALKPDAAASNV